MAMERNKPVFPLETLLKRFTEGSSEEKAVMELKDAFMEAFPDATTSSSVPKPGTSLRGKGGCDYSVDGQTPLDVSRVVELAHKSNAECPTDRLGSVVGKAGRPTIIIDKEHGIWLMNGSQEAMEMSAGELFGFGCGEYVNQICDSPLRKCLLVSTAGEDITPSGLPWALKSDVELISYQKEVMPLCALLRKLALEKGLAEVEVEFHVVVPKTIPAAVTRLFDGPPSVSQDGGDPTPVSFRLVQLTRLQLRCRYDVARTESKKTAVFKPMQQDGENLDSMKKAVLGAVFLGSMQKVPRSNKKAALVWEAC